MSCGSTGRDITTEKLQPAISAILAIRSSARGRVSPSKSCGGSLFQIKLELKLNRNGLTRSRLALSHLFTVRQAPDK